MCELCVQVFPTQDVYISTAQLEVSCSIFRVESCVGAQRILCCHGRAACGPIWSPSSYVCGGLAEMGAAE